MDAAVTRVDLEPRHEGAVLRLSLSRAALHDLTQNGELHARMGEEGVFLMEDSPLELVHGDDAVELVRLEVHVADE